ncbi:RNA-dependent RNA polymerase [Heterobasidion partitivirus 15]|uniref:RNA-dependent RNA polymerase n=1 Tax=Heterobasidion partitivirus 15 TaxID=1469908 RepID=W8PR84_9VIRU|nr:RNA-dependent RNA polymerase [Heterobasidion partitivirus 15]AHL25162.1 RNA-dependent RNA polymerase [Heterobasidion partitivirus 15]
MFSLLTWLSTKFNALFDSVYSTRFEHNFRFLYKAAPLTTPHRDETKYAEYQAYVKSTLDHVLLGPDAHHIVNGYHHPIATLDAVINTFKKGDLPDHKIPKDLHYYSALLETTKRFAPPQKLRPVHFADLRFYKWNWHPNVEEPFRSEAELQQAVEAAYHAGLLPDGRMSFGNLKNVVFIRVREWLHQIKRAQITNPNTLYPLINIHVKPALTTPDETKIRVVYGVSKLHVLPEAMFFWPLFRHYLDNRKESPLLWGFETILGGMAVLHNMMTIPRLYFQTFVMVDWSGFDLRSLFEPIRTDVFPAWRTYFDFNNGYIPTRFYRTSKADPEHLKRLWEWTREACLRMPHRMMDGSVYERLFRCIPSGLFTTQFLDSFYNMLMILTILSAMGIDISTVVIRVQGDDSLIMLQFFLPANQHEEFKARFQALATYYFDHIARPEKTDISNSPEGVNVLGYTNENGYPIRDWRKLLAQLYHPRSQRPTLELLKARVCGIQYASMYRYPQVTEVCQTLWNRLEADGIKALNLAAQRDVVLHSHADFFIPTDHFPTLNEVTKWLRVPYQRTAEDREEYFPLSHFLSYF